MYCAYLNDRYINETIYSILSLLNSSKSKSIPIIVFTDQKDKFSDIFIKYSNVEINNISHATLLEWMGISHYVFRLKLQSIRYCFECYGNINLLFVDSDTYFIKPIDFSCIGSYSVYMHSRLCPMEKAINLIEAESFNLQDYSNYSNVYKRYCLYKDIMENRSNLFDIANNTFIPYNSGTIGISAKNKKLIDEAIDLSDSIYASYNFNCAEEFALSWVFSKHAISILESHDSIVHYCYFKETMLLLAYVLNFYFGSDQKILKEFLEKYNIKNLSAFHLDLNNLNLFVKFIISFLMKFDKQKVFHKVYYDEGSHLYLHNSLQEFKRLYKIYCEINPSKRNE